MHLPHSAPFKNKDTSLKVVGAGFLYILCTSLRRDISPAVNALDIEDVSEYSLQQIITELNVEYRFHCRAQVSLGPLGIGDSFLPSWFDHSWTFEAQVFWIYHKVSDLFPNFDLFSQYKS